MALNRCSFLVVTFLYHQKCFHEREQAVQGFSLQLSLLHCSTCPPQSGMILVQEKHGKLACTICLVHGGLEQWGKAPLPAPYTRGAGSSSSLVSARHNEPFLTAQLCLGVGEGKQQLLPQFSSVRVTPVLEKNIWNTSLPLNSWSLGEVSSRKLLGGASTRSETGYFCSGRNSECLSNSWSLLGELKFSQQKRNTSTWP